MQAVSSWLLSIAGVIILSVLCEFVLPDGQINKYVRLIFSFITLFVVIAPLPKLVGINMDFSDFYTYDGGYQEEYLYELNSNKLNALTENLNSAIAEQGYSGVVVSLSANVFAEELELYDVYVDIESASFGKGTTKEKAKEVITDILDYLNIPIEFSS